MGKPPRNVSGDTTPPSLPQTTPPQDLFATSDIRFVMLEIGKLVSKTDRLIDDVGKMSSKIGDLERAVDRVKTGVWVALPIIGAVSFVAWWLIGDRIGSAVKGALLDARPPITSSAPAAPR